MGAIRKRPEVGSRGFHCELSQFGIGVLASIIAPVPRAKSSDALPRLAGQMRFASAARWASMAGTMTPLLLAAFRVVDTGGVTIAIAISAVFTSSGGFAQHQRG